MTILDSNYSPSHRPQVAEYRRLGYLANGWNRVRRWNGRTTTLETAGIFGPDPTAGAWAPAPTASAGSSTVGVHVFRYRYQDSRTGYVSNPSNEFEVEIVAGSEKLTFDIDDAGSTKIVRSTDSKVDTIILEMTVAGDGATFYEVAEVRQTATEIAADLADALLEQELLPYEDDGHDPPPLAKNILSHRDRLWLYGQVIHNTGTASVTLNSPNVDAGATDPDWLEEALGDSSGNLADGVWFFQLDGSDSSYEIDYYDNATTKIVLKEDYAEATQANVAYRIFSRVNSIWISEPGYPEGFVPLKFVNGPNGEGAGDLTAGIGYATSVVFFARSSMFKFSWDLGPHEDGFMTPLSSLAGALNQRVVLEVEGTVYSMDRRGWHAWRGIFPETISRSVDPYRDEIDYTLSERFHACWFPEIRAIRWFVCYTGDTYPKHYFQFDVDAQTWSTGEYLSGISDSKLVPSEGQRRVLLGDENGHRWFADVGTSDGVPAVLSHLTTDAGSTDTAIVTVDSLPTTNVGLAGCWLHKRYDTGTGESRLITGNIANIITLGTGFTSAPVAGEVLWVGPIPTKLKTRAFRSVKGPRRVKKVPYLSLLFGPTVSTRRLQVRVYEDLSSTAKVWATDIATISDTQYPGENLSYPTTDWLVDLSATDGYVSIAVGSEFCRHREFELEILEPDADFKLVNLEFDGHAVEEEIS